MFHSDEPEMQPESPPEPSLDEVLDAALSESAAHPVPPAEPPSPAEEAADDVEERADSTPGTVDAEESAPAGEDESDLDFLGPDFDAAEVAAGAAASRAVEPAPQPVDDEAIQRLEAENSDLKDRYMRAMAELENVRKRSRRELETSTNLAKANVLRELLEVADNFARALESATYDDGTSERGLAEGVRLIYVQFMDILRQNGCERIQAKGMPFDPNLHEAISQIETDEVPSQHVFEVVQEGYTLNNNVLRPARVVVAV